MIKIERNKVPQNTSMDQKKATELEKIKKAIDKKSKPQFVPLWTRDRKVKEYLGKSQYGKCCYCEQKRNLAESDVEHFRPKAELKENKKHPGYWWLAYSWDNLLISCKKCNNRKGTNFPLKDESKRVFSEKDDLQKEEPFLINPLTENPEKFIKYDIPENNTKPPMIKAIGKCERGDKTVNELTGINSENVPLRRAEKFEHYLYLCKYLALLKKDNSNNCAEIEQVKKDMRKMQDSSSEFAGLARDYFIRVLGLRGLND